MSNYSHSYTNTYTVADVRRVLNSLAADFSMIAQATGLRTRESVDNTVEDLKCFAEKGYLKTVDLILYDALGIKLKAARYTVSEAAGGWVVQSPGNNLWPRTPGGRLREVITYTPEFLKLTPAARTAFELGLNVSWEPTDVDLRHLELRGVRDRCYASNAWGVEKMLFS